MQTTLQRLPRFVARSGILLLLEQSLLDAPCHAIEEQGRTRHLGIRVIDNAHQTGAPESVGVLTSLQRLAHQEEVLLQFLILFALLVEHAHGTYQSCIDPAVATTPVAVLAVLLLIGRHIVLVAPPQSFLDVEATAATLVAAPAVALHGIVQIALVLGDGVHLDIDGQCHLDGVNPRPVVHTS